MFWNDLKAIKEEVLALKHSMLRIERALCDATFNGKSGVDLTDVKTAIKDCFDDVFESEEEYSSINRLHDKLNSLVNDDRRKEEVELATKTLDKFEDYMKNVDKLNEMANELKGCVSMARGAIGEGRALTGAIQQVQHIANISETIYKAMKYFVEAADKLEAKAHYKIDFIYKKVEEIAEKLQNCEKKSRKPRKSVKKKRAVSAAPLSE